MQRLHLTLDLGVLHVRGRGAFMNTSNGIKEHTPRINVRVLKGLTAGEKYIVQLPGGDKFNLIWHGNVVEFRYFYEDERVIALFEINETPTGYGTRKWFTCNGCKKNTSNLYILSGVLACRSCHKLIYLSSVYSGNELNGLALKIRRLQLELDFEGEVYDFPVFKPKNMHWNTFGRMMKELRALQIERDQVWARSATAFLGGF